MLPVYHWLISGDTSADRSEHANFDDFRGAKKTEKTYDFDGQFYLYREYIGFTPKLGPDGYGKIIAGNDIPQADLVI